MSYENPCSSSGMLFRKFAVVDRGGGWTERVYVCTCGGWWLVPLIRSHPPRIPYHPPQKEPA